MLPFLCIGIVTFADYSFTFLTANEIVSFPSKKIVMGNDDINNLVKERS